MKTPRWALSRRDGRSHLLDDDASELMISMASELLAVWDGQPARGYGGTADVVAHARDRGVRRVWPEGAIRD